MIIDSVFTGEHVVMVWAFGVIAFALRNIPKPNSVWALWMISVAQFAFMNLSVGNANITAARISRQDPGTGDGK